MKEISIEGKRLLIVPIIYGLIGEEKKIKEAFNKFTPDCIAIGIPPEDIEIVGNIKDGEFDLSLQHQYYLFHLSKYGKISLPPLDIKIAYEISCKNNIPLHAIDIDDNEYADILTKNVSIFSLIRHSRKVRKLLNKEFEAKNAEEFVREWNKEINSIGAFRRLEEMREQRMVENILSLSRRYKKILAIVPLEKYDGIMSKLERYKKQ